MTGAIANSKVSAYCCTWVRAEPGVRVQNWCLMLVVKKERVDNLGLNPISHHGPGEAMIEHINLYQHVPYTNYTKTQVCIKGNLMFNVMEYFEREAEA